MELELPPRPACYRVHNAPFQFWDMLGALDPEPEQPPPTEPLPVIAELTPPATIEAIDDTPIELAVLESVDSLCLSIRKAYLEHLYSEDKSVHEYSRYLHSTTSKITNLAARESTNVQDAQQQLSSFIVEFLRIWPARMESKFKQIGKEMGISKFVEKKSQDHYPILLQDERPILDEWKAKTNTDVNDKHIVAKLRALKTKDMQLQIVLNLHVLHLSESFETEERRPYKKDPGAKSNLTAFMDSVCIAASAITDSLPVSASAVASPGTPKSKDMDPAKKFFIRVIRRNYGSSLSKVVEELSIQCGMESSLMMSPKSPRISRGGIKRFSMMKRSQSMGVLTTVEKHSNSAAGPSTIRELLEARGTGAVSSKTALNSSIFRRQVVMPKDTSKKASSTSSSSSAAVKALAKRTSSSSLVTTKIGTSTSSSTSTLQSKSQSLSSLSRPGLYQSSSQPLLERLKSAAAEDGDSDEEGGQPRLAKLKLKRFYHDKEAEVTIKMLGRQRPLSKADAFGGTLSMPFFDNDQDTTSSLGELGQYLSGSGMGGTSSWGFLNNSLGTSSLPSLGAANKPTRKDTIDTLKNWNQRDNASSTSGSSSVMDSRAMQALVPPSLPFHSAIEDPRYAIPTTPTRKRSTQQQPSQSVSSPSIGAPSTASMSRRQQQQQEWSVGSGATSVSNGMLAPPSPSGLNETVLATPTQSTPKRNRHTFTQFGDDLGDDGLTSPKGRRGASSYNRSTMLKSPTYKHPSSSSSLMASPTNRRSSSSSLLTNSLFDTLRATRPDRKRVRLNQTDNNGSSREQSQLQSQSSSLIYVPATPSNRTNGKYSGAAAAKGDESAFQSTPTRNRSGRTGSNARLNVEDHHRDLFNLSPSHRASVGNRNDGGHAMQPLLKSPSSRKHHPSRRPRDEFDDDDDDFDDGNEGSRRGGVDDGEDLIQSVTRPGPRLMLFSADD